MNITKAVTEAYLDRLIARRDPSPDTLRAYRSDLADYRRFLDAQDPGDSADLLLSYIRHLSQKRRLAIRTVRRRIACLRGLYKDLVRTKVIAQSPFQTLDLEVPRAKSLPRSLTRQEATLLARAASRDCLVSGSDRDFAVAVLVLLSTGLRISELLGLKPADLDVAGGLSVKGKGRRERRVPIVDPRLRDTLLTLATKDAARLFNSKAGGWTAQTFRRRLRAFALDAGLTRRVTPHMLRHTSATLLLEDGVDLLFLQRLLGHENIATTAIYAHVGDASLKRALEKASLLSRLAA